MNRIAFLFLSLLFFYSLSGCGQFNKSNVSEPFEKEIGYSKINEVGKGALSGRILLNGTPVSGVSIYLGNVLSDENGNPLATSIDRSMAPLSVTDENGYFQMNAEAGEYGVMFSNTPEVYLLLFPNEDRAIIIKIVEGEEYYLGVLNYSDLPLN
jgi:hypothetical protein